MPVFTALQFLSACLLLGLGLFLASESAQRLRLHVAPVAVVSGVAVVGSLLTAFAGAYWAANIVQW